MIADIFVIFLTAALFLTMILLLAAKPRFARKLTGIFLVCAALGGMFFYGYGFAVTIDNFPLAVIRALLGVCGMFVAKMDMGSISAAPLMQYPAVQLLFWIVHLFALYVTASAAITTVGAEALRRLQLWMARRGHLNLIYGLDEKTMELGKSLVSKKNSAVVFVDGKPDPALAAAVSKNNCVLRSDGHALKADITFIRSLGVRPGKREVTLYAMGTEADDSLEYARKLLVSLEELNIQPAQTTLVIRGHEDSPASALQNLGSTYGYGSVNVVQEAQMVSRMLMRNFPPCNTMNFDADCKATEDFEALILGFGKLGQAVLKNLVMNAQFEGSTFRAAVFAPDCATSNGYFSSSFSQVLENYDVSFHPYDGRSSQLYDYLASRGKKIKYLVICTGSDKLNHELAEGVLAYLSRVDCHIPAYLCTYQSIKQYGSDGSICKTGQIYRPEVLSMTGLDRMAMLLNHYYTGNREATPTQTWMACDYFSRMSSRASADFVTAMLRIAGKTDAPVGDGQWEFTDIQLENLSRTEHRRWCAFHHCMGFRAMTAEEFAARAEQYQMQRDAGQTPTIRISKDMQSKTHACLIPWEELDELSRRENAITGKNVCYKKMDTDNVMVLPRLLKASLEAEV